MSAAERIHRIRARCVELLAIAENRTPGEWKHGTDKSGEWTEFYGTSGNGVPWSNFARAVIVMDGKPDSEGQANAAFIAACAGAAEAGWRSTIAAIDQILAFPIMNGLNKGHQSAALVAILAAWPE